MSTIALVTSGATWKPSLAANRAARSIRSGSSANDSRAVAGVRIVCSRRSISPPYGSENTWPGTETAIALIVKSRRRRSSCRLSPYETIGFRLTRSYASARNVVISRRWPSRAAPIVPKSAPMVHTSSAQPLTILSVSSGRALVAKSRSSPSLPRSASRTEPPTRCSSWPAAANRSPSSSTIGKTRSNSATARR